MKHIIVAVTDIQLGAFNRPFTVPTIGAAIRMFGDEVSRGGDDNQMASHPEDFQLFHLASWDDDSGRFENLDLPVLIAKATDYVKKA